MSTEARILNLLEAGMKQEQVAMTLGISAGYVSQIANQQVIKTKVLDAHAKLLDEATQRDQKYNSIEDQLLDKMEKSIPSLYKPQDVLRALTAINKAERRGATSQQIAELANKKNESVVELELPDRIKTKFVKSHTKEVVEVDGRVLVSRDSRLLYAEVMAQGEKDEINGFNGIDVDLPDLRSTRAAISAPENNGKQLPPPENPEKTKDVFAALFAGDAEPSEKYGK